MSKPVIAVVDDDPLILKMLNMLLTHEGYETILWSDAESACDMIRQRHPDVVTLDLLMQDDWNAGLRVLECLRADPTTTDIPVIIVSGTADTLRGEDSRLGTLAYAMLVKPVSLETLLNYIASALK